MNNTITAGDLFKHYKGGIYVVSGVAKLESTGEEMIIYRKDGPGDPTVWVRPKSEWIEFVDGKPRYEPISFASKERFGVK